MTTMVSFCKKSENEIWRQIYRNLFQLKNENKLGQKRNMKAKSEGK